eukprot:jgi/Orpsp1_1/1179260/evm.model.c7180000068643.1
MKFVKLLLALWLLVAVITASPLNGIKSKLPSKNSNQSDDKNSIVDELVEKIPRNTIARLVEKKICKDARNAKKCKNVSEEIADRIVDSYGEFFNQFSYEDKAKACKNLTSKDAEKAIDELNEEIRNDLKKKGYVITIAYLKTIAKLVRD